MANSLLVWAKRIPDRLSSNSIPAERIAATCCEVLLNQPTPLSEDFYKYVGGLLGRYKEFSIKYEGFQNLWQAVKYRLTPSVPQTILWMRTHIREEFPYRFDVFDPQYDILAKKLERESYMELFVEQLLYSRTAIPLKRWIARYHQLTGGDLVEYFNEYHCYDERLFALMVEQKAIDLWQFFEQHKTNGANTRPLKHIRTYRPFHAFAEIGEDMDGAEWRQLSIPEKVTRHYEFHSRENLHEVVRQPILRRKLGKFLDQHFYWSGIEKIVIHDDGQPFSFFFQEYTSSGPGICGGIILHSAGDLQKSQYSIHT